MARLGSEKRPAVIRVRTLPQAEQILHEATERGWKVIVGIEPDKPERLEDWKRLKKAADRAVRGF